MKRTILCVLLFVFLAAILTACALHKGPEAQAPGHPPLNEQEMLVACHECHAKATPQVYQQWYESGHGIASVKCYQCHGTFENLRTEPSLDSCAVCHSGQWAHSGGEKCWQCHPAHFFKARR